MQPNQPLTDKEIILITAYLANGRGIGFQGKLAWEDNPIKTDLNRFKKETMGNTVIMGRGTMDSMNRKHLPGRENIVVSNSLKQEELPKGFLLAKSIEEALQMATGEKIFPIGGEHIYNYVVQHNIANKILTTVVHADLPADRFFPSLEESQWRNVSTGNPVIDEKSGIKIHFETFINKQNPHFSEVF